jgi:hypothetical protein
VESLSACYWWVGLSGYICEDAMTDLDQRAKLLDDNVRLSKEIERLEAELNRVTDRLLQRDRMVAEFEHKQFHLLWMLETAGIDSSAAKQAECVLGDDCPHFTGGRDD